jgi:hypothetical protein
MDYRVAIDTSKQIASQFQVRGIPQAAVFDTKGSMGKVAFFHCLFVCMRRVWVYVMMCTHVSGWVSGWVFRPFGKLEYIH